MKSNLAYDYVRTNNTIRRTAKPVTSIHTKRYDSDVCLGEKLGVVKSFNDYDRPGYGHICEYIDDIKVNEYFVHYTDIRSSGFRNLAKGQLVKFTAYRGIKGLYAKEVSVVNV